MNEQQLSEHMEQLLVARNPRRMELARAALKPGYCLRAARLLRALDGAVIIGTGFPVAGTFETDGPVGAIALYRALETLGARPYIACGAPLSLALANGYRVLALGARDLASATEEARALLAKLRPQAVVAIEHPGLAADGRCYNMRGEDITAHCTFLDPFFWEARCPTIAIGDGGNEAGMGNIAEALADLAIRPSTTRCDELVVADVSNWGAYALVAFLGRWSGRDLLGETDPMALLHFLLGHGGVDGVTGLATLTEDGQPALEGVSVLASLRALT